MAVAMPTARQVPACGAGWHLNGASRRDKYGAPIAVAYAMRSAPLLRR
jgi:hypothetical protein